MNYRHSNDSPFQSQSVKLLRRNFILRCSGFTQSGTSRGRFPGLKQNLLCLRGLEDRFMLFVKNIFINKPK